MTDERDPDLAGAEGAMRRAAEIARTRLSERIAGRRSINGSCKLCRHWPAEEYAFREVHWLDDKDRKRIKTEPCPWTYCPYVEGEDDQGFQADFDAPTNERKGVVVSLAAWKVEARLRYRVGSERALTESEED